MEACRWLIDVAVQVLLLDTGGVLPLQHAAVVPAAQ
jgi:hypothetical protein